MAIKYSRYLIGKNRTEHANHLLGCTLAFVAGAINAGGFLAVQQYTSHMTGIISFLADNLALGKITLIIKGIIAVAFFLWGAICCTIMVNFGERRGWSSKYAAPLLLEAILILIFGLVGSQLTKYKGFLVSYTVIHLCYIMGLQNALVTKLSNSVIRTTHMTGVITDLGIELGRLVYINIDKNNPYHVKANRKKLFLLSVLLFSFFGGGLVGAFGFKYFGYFFTIPIAIILATIAIFPTLDDLYIFIKNTFIKDGNKNSA